MGKHTPGPWRWDEEVPTSYLGANWQEVAPWLVDGDGYPVLEGQIACPNQNNLALIAAAPELLEALEDLVRINEQHNTAIQSVTGKPAGWKDDYLNQARAAIAKARGETQ